MKKTNEFESKGHRRNADAFSLIEITLALGVVSFAFVALMGILPVGLQTFNRSVDASTESQIAQSILTQARQAKFSELANFANTDQFNFDEQGKALSTGDRDKRIYYADTAGTNGDGPDIKIYFKKQLEVGESPSMNGGVDPTDMNVAVVSITVRKISAPKEKRTLMAYIANNGF